jgi:putative transposase
MSFTDPKRHAFVRPKSRGELPHLYREGGTYFVTFRLFDAVVPREMRSPSVEHAPEFDAPERLLEDYDPPITLGSCLLARRPVAELVQNAFRHFDGDRYELLAWCVMPNHVHVIFVPLGGHQPSDILHSWKSFTSHAINKLLGRSGALWERESFDHLVRSMRSLERFIRYTEQNPVAAGLCDTALAWPFSSRSGAVD